MTWNENAIGVIFVYLSVPPSNAIVFAWVICRPSLSRLRLRDRFVLYLVFLALVFSRLSCHPSPGSVVKTVVCAHAGRERQKEQTEQLRQKILKSYNCSKSFRQEYNANMWRHKSIPGEE